MIWTEKYRPSTLTEVVGQETVVELFSHWLEQGDMPNVLLYGAPGTGKTAIIHAYANDLYGKKKRSNFKELNASDDRGINVVRTDVKKFGSYAPDEFPFKILYLGEIDGLTKDAQDALKRTIETSADTVRFVADCNNVHALIPAIQSRFVRMCCRTLYHQQIEERLTEIFNLEHDDPPEPETIKELMRVCDYDLRTSIQLLQALPVYATPAMISHMKPTVEEEAVAKLASEVFFGGDYDHDLYKCMAQTNWDGMSILEKFYKSAYHSKDLIESIRVKVITTIGEFMWRITQPCDPMIQMRCCMAQIRLVMKDG